ncbi:hypothetical protein O1611_g4415 [Lasiodiplodia mahajangana]|uniref:Uncharacterized protein n=1 Tax=Lasiodiplodia mahajangana TaxID=1108764 RepID=A0ACC2JP01_9PEZI|nr:hypothetical protein O1611_g4415 [Lasiodiplodia mahajangana]
MRTGVLFNLCAGIALARATDASGAVHPFVKYKKLAVDAGVDATLATTTAAPTPTRPALECFQVAEPVLTPSGVTRRDSSQAPAIVAADQIPIEAAAASSSASSCSVVLMVHTFANSYGFPYVGMHRPIAASRDL